MFAPSLYLMSHAGQLSLAIPPSRQNEYKQKPGRKHSHHIVEEYLY